jgi:hypothetical protein
MKQFFTGPPGYSIHVLLKFLPDIDPVTYKDLPDQVKICLSGESFSTSIVSTVNIYSTNTIIPLLFFKQNYIKNK